MTSAAQAKFTDTEIHVIMDTMAAGRSVHQAGVMTSLLSGEQTLSIFFADGTHLNRPLVSSDRQRVEALVETLIDLVDRMDGDTDREFDPAEHGIADEDAMAEQYGRPGFMGMVV
jgi:hypothetical protein